MGNYIKTGILLTSMTLFFIFIGGLVGGREGAVIALIFATLMNFFSYWFSSSIVLKMYKAVPIQEKDSPELYGIVRNLASKAKLPMPKVCIIKNDAPNAFATGRNPKHAVVAVTTGLMRILNRDELEGVLAHELTHIYGRDILIGSIAASMAGAVMLLADMARFGAIFGSGGDSDSRNSNTFVVLLVALLAPVAAMIIQMAISRTREYNADAGAAKLTRNPMALASALQKISGEAARRPMQGATEATAHMFIINPLAGKKADNLFSTHPDTRNRIARLVEMSKKN